MFHNPIIVHDVLYSKEGEMFLDVSVSGSFAYNFTHHWILVGKSRLFLFEHFQTLSTSFYYSLHIWKYQLQAGVEAQIKLSLLKPMPLTIILPTFKNYKFHQVGKNALHLFAP